MSKRTPEQDVSDGRKLAEEDQFEIAVPGELDRPHAEGWLKLRLNSFEGRLDFDVETDDWTATPVSLAPDDVDAFVRILQAWVVRIRELTE